ncbi:MAG: sensor histidine kinase [Pseudomonadales bacterium]
MPDLCNGRAVFILVLVTELLVLTMVLAASGIRSFAWEDFALISMFVLWIALTSSALLCGLRKVIERLSLQWSVVAVMGLILLVTTLFTVLADWALAGADFSRFDVQVDAYDLVRNLLVSLVMAGMVLRYFYVQTQLRRQERSELRARIQALQSRINPHFLFNSMNSIASLISVDPETAEQAVEDLCELFRASLRESTEPVPLSQELELCRRYMAIEQLRLGERLKVSWDIKTLPEQATLPLLTLQPVMENAVYHGIQPLPEGGEITVKIDVISGAKTSLLQVCVSNPLAEIGLGHGHESGHRMALDNIRDRLEALYDGEARLDIEQNEQSFVACLTVPFSEEVG